jgi:hypothetical protein
MGDYERALLEWRPKLGRQRANQLPIAYARKSTFIKLAIQFVRAGSVHVDLSLKVLRLELVNVPLRETRSRFPAEGGRSPSIQGGGQSRTTRSGGHRSARSGAKEDREEVACHRSLTARGKCPLKPVKRGAILQSPEVSVRGRRPTHKRAEGVLQNVREDRSGTEPESTRSPQARCLLGAMMKACPAWKAFPITDCANGFTGF